MDRFELKSRDGKVHVVDRDWVRLGRADDNDIIIKDPAVSRYHLNFYVKEGRLIVEDAGSQNGFLLNGTKAPSATTLKPGDRLLVGGYEYAVRAPGQAGASAPSATPSFSSTPVESPDEESRKKRIRIYAGLAVGLLVIALVSKKEEAPPGPPEENLSSADLKKVSQAAGRGSTYRQKSPSEIRSEALFREAKRDYDNNNFSRAYIGFQDAKTLNPENEEALAYMEYCEAGMKNQIDTLLKDANVSFDKLQYRRAKSQAAQVLTILSERVAGYGRKMTLEAVTPNLEGRRPAGQEETLLKLPCEQTPEADACTKAVNLINEARRLMGEEDTYR